MIEHRSSNASCPGENVAHAQPSVRYKEDEIQNSNFEYVPSTRLSEDPEENDMKPAANRIKKEPEDDVQSVTQDEPKVETTFKPWEDKKDYEAIFRKYISIGDDGEEYYDMTYMERDAQRAVRRIQDDPEEDDRKPAAKRIEKEPEDDVQSVTQDEPKIETTFKPWEDKKDYEAIFRKYISIGDDGEDYYDMTDMERDAQRALRRIQDHQK